MYKYWFFKQNHITSASLSFLESKTEMTRTQISTWMLRLNLVYRNPVFNPLKFETSWYGINDRKQTCKYYVNFGTSNSWDGWGL